MLPKLDNLQPTDKIESNDHNHIEKLKILKEFLCKDQVYIRPMPITLTNAFLTNKENQQKLLFSALLKNKQSPAQQQKKPTVSEFSSIHTSLRKKAISQRSTYHRKNASLNHKNNTQIAKSPKSIQKPLKNLSLNDNEINKVGKEFKFQKTNTKIRSTSTMKCQKLIENEKIKDKERVRLSDIFDVVDKNDDTHGFKHKPKNKKRKCYLQWNCDESITQKFRVFKIL